MRKRSDYVVLLCVLLSIFCGRTSVEATTTGSVFVWGSNQNGEWNVPPPNEDFVAIAAGDYHNLALKSNGSIVAWERNFDAYGRQTNQCIVPLPNSNFTAIAASTDFSLALKADGSIVAWGRQESGQCNVPAPNEGFIAIVAKQVHCLGLKADGSIVAWGSNQYGESDVPTPNTGFVAIAAGYDHSLALKADGSIVMWGRPEMCNYPSPNSDFVAIDAGQYHSMGLKSDGSIVIWGDSNKNTYGQCEIPTPNSGFIAIASGQLHCLGLKSDGTVVAWGFNRDGQGVPPSPNAGFMAISAGSGQSMGLKTTPPPPLPVNRSPVVDAGCDRIVYDNGSANRQLHIIDMGDNSTHSIDLSNYLTVSPDQISSALVAQPSWSRDGRKMTFYGGLGLHAQIYVWELTDHGYGIVSCERISPDSGDLVNPGFSPDGSKIAYNQVYGNVQTIDMSSRIISDIGNQFGQHPDWTWSTTPTTSSVPLGGSQIVFGQTGWGPLKVYRISPDNSKSTIQLQTSPYSVFSMAFWSPDRKKLAVVIPNPITGIADIGVINEIETISPDLTYQVTNLTEDWSSSIEEHPNWSRDGKFIYFHSTRDGTYDLWRMNSDINGSGKIKIASTSGDECSPSIASGGTVVIHYGQQTGKTIFGQAYDPDGDKLEFRWLDDGVELTSWLPLNIETPAGNATLYLGGLPLFDAGNHILTLQVTDGTALEYMKVPLRVEGPLMALVDLDPDTLNLKSSGRYITAYITLPEGFTASEIDQATIRITQINEDIIFDFGIDTTFTPVVGDRDEDGIPDMTVKFNRQELIELPLLPGDRSITVGFELNNGTRFEGSDIIRVIKRGK